MLKSLNPLALSLSHYIRTSNGDVDKKKLTEVSQLLTSGKSCNSDNVVIELILDYILN